MSTITSTGTGSPAQANGCLQPKAKKPSRLELIRACFGVIFKSPNVENLDELKCLKEARRKSRSKRNKPWTWGIITGLIGLCLLVLTICLEEQFHPTTFWKTLVLQFSGHLGIAGLLLGIVGITVEFKNWTEYFEERLAYTIRKKEFLTTLKPEELRSLLDEVFLAIYKVRNFDRDSFLSFFTTGLQDYIGSPFREDTISMITVGPPGLDGCCKVEEDLIYKCRKLDGESLTIQDDVSWSMNDFDIAGELEDYKVTLKLPRERQKGFSLRSSFPPCADGSYVFAKSDLNLLGDYLTDLREKGDVLKKQGDEPRSSALSFREEGKVHGFKLTLKEFKDIDGLSVHEHVEYSIRTDSFFATQMRYPSKGLEVDFKYPDQDFELFVEVFGMDGPNLTVINQTGSYKLKYDSWLLPLSGLAHRLIRKKQSPTQAAAADNNGAGAATHNPVREKFILVSLADSTVTPESTPVSGLTDGHQAQPRIGLRAFD